MTQSSNMVFTDIVLEIPRWLPELLPPADHVFASDQEKMALAIQLAEKNITQGGGPFGAILVDSNSGKLVSAGVNQVVASCCSVAHAEIMAIMLGQKSHHTFNLGDIGQIELISSAEPCAQCFGAIPWSGVCRVVCGARAEDTEAIGFDEGPKPHDWVAQLEQRHISVTRDILRQEACAALQAYKAAGFIVYNGRLKQ